MKTAFLAPLIAAWQLGRGRRAKQLLWLIQFTIGLAALLLFAVVLYATQIKVQRLTSTFGPSEVLGLVPAVLDHQRPPSDRPLLTIDYLPELAALPGVARAAVLWQGEAELSTGETITIYGVNDALQELIGLDLYQTGGGRVQAISGEPRQAYLTKQGWHLLADDRNSDQIQFHVRGATFTLPLAGTADPAVGWPNLTLEKEISTNVPALVVDVGILADALPLSISNSVWLQMTDDSDEATLQRALYDWSIERMPGHYLLGEPVSEKVNAFSGPARYATWMGGLFSILLISLIAFGFIGQSALQADLRRREWAIRSALGASKGALALQVFFEHSFLVTTALLLSLALAIPVGPQVLKALLPFHGKPLPYLEVLWPSLRLIGLMALLISVISAWVPMMRLRRADLTTVMKENW